MTADVVPDKAKVARDPAPTNAQRASLQAELEERLAAARVERAKVLAAKGKSAKKPNARRRQSVGGEVRPSVTKVTSGMSTEVPCKAELAPPPQVTTPPQARISAVARAEAQQPAAPKRLLSRTATIAFASFFGLGFGMVLSFGAVVGLGWVSLSDIKGKVGTAEPVAAAAPTLLDNPDLDFSSAELVSASPAVPAMVSAQKPTMPQRVPALRVAEVPDETLTSVLSPSPLGAATGEVMALSAPSAALPTAVGFSSEAPVRKAATRAARMSQPGYSKDLPLLAEPNSLRVLAAMPAIAAPAPAASAVPSHYADPEGPRNTPVPVLFDPEPAAHLTIAVASPVRPSVEVTGIGQLGLFRVGDVTSETHVAGVNAAPTLPPLSSLATPVAAYALPVTGGPVIRPPSLAAKLGYVGQDANQIALITYAPTSVTSAALDEKLGDLETTGFPIAAPSRVNFKVSKTHVRYYSRADETVARAIAAEVGGAARDFTREKIASPSGRIEIWMAGSRVGSPAPKRAAASTTQRRAALKAQQQAVAKAQLKSRLVDRLKQREYLR